MTSEPRIVCPVCQWAGRQSTVRLASSQFWDRHDPKSLNARRYTCSEGDLIATMRLPPSPFYPDGYEQIMDAISAADLAERGKYP